MNEHCNKGCWDRCCKNYIWRIVQKSAEDAGDLIRNKIRDKILSISKPKNEGRKEDIEMNETWEICIPPEKSKQIINRLSN